MSYYLRLGVYKRNFRDNSLGPCLCGNGMKVQDLDVDLNLPWHVAVSVVVICSIHKGLHELGLDPCKRGLVLSFVGYRSFFFHVYVRTLVGVTSLVATMVCGLQIWESLKSWQLWFLLLRCEVSTVELPMQ